MVAFSVYAVTSDQPLDAQVAFVSISLLSALIRPFNILPNGIAMLIQATVSLQRVNKYLNSSELETHENESKCFRPRDLA